jgi:hypothetical protein
MLKSPQSPSAQIFYEYMVEGVHLSADDKPVKGNT